MKRDAQHTPQKRTKGSQKAERVTEKKGVTPAEVREFQGMIYRHYREHGRKLPWRMTQNPYRILVSEIMLQQTPVQRVTGKYERFIKIFPDFSSLARAPLRMVLREWQGLGYNRRAIAIKQIARRVMEEFHGNLPPSVEILMTFPGIGRATASAVSAFAFCIPTVFIETNIRRVFIHRFFHDRTDIRDAEILPLVEETLDTSNPREWYYALMDYGVMLKQRYENFNRRSAHYQRQPPFQGSNRQIRGMILKTLSRELYVSEREIAQKFPITPEKIKNTLIQLEKEGFVKKRRKRFTLM